MFEWTLMKRLIWIKAAVISGAASLYETVTGAIVSFVALHAKALKKLVVNIKPVQDLHGYAAPWPPGGGKNKWYFPEYSAEDYTKMSSSITVSVDVDAQSMTMSTVGQGQTLVLILRPFAPGQYSLSFNISKYNKRSFIRCYDAGGNILTNADVSVTGATWNSFYQGFYLSQGTFTVPNEVDHFCVALGATDDTSGDTVVISSVQLELGPSVTAWQPYENECPISGWTGAEVYATGVNVWDEETELGSLDTTTGLPVPVTAQIRAKNFVPVVGGETYRIVTTDSPNGIWMLFYDSSKQVITEGLPAVGSQANNARRIGHGYTVPMPSNCAFIRFYFQNGYGTTYNNDTSINYPSTDLSYHAYVGDVRQISWQDEAGTVYGGTVTVKQDGSVDLVVNRAELDLGSPTWIPGNRNIANTGRIFYITGLSVGSTEALCSIYKQTTLSWEAMPVNTFFLSMSGGLIICADYNDKSALVADVTGQKLVYEIAEPVTYHLDSITQLSTVVGTNNIWANTGDVEVTYYAA